MNTEKMESLIEFAQYADHSFLGKYDPNIRVIFFDRFANVDEDNAVIFHQPETVTVAALMNRGVEPRLAAALVADGIIGVAEPVVTDGDFETSDGAHWSLPINLSTDIAISIESYLVWSIGEDGAPHDIEEFDPSNQAIKNSHLPHDLADMINTRMIVTKHVDLKPLAGATPHTIQKALRKGVTDQIAPAFAGKADPLIRACRTFWDEVSISAFNYRDTLGIAALVRIGVPTRFACALVDQDYAFATPIGGDVNFPSVRPFGHPGANWEPADVFTLSDGTQWALMMADIGPISNVTDYDVWSLRGAAREIGNIADAKGRPLHDPTRKTISGWLRYRHVASKFRGMCV